MRYFVSIIAFAAFVVVGNAQTHFAEIRVLDSATGRGVPLVELETVNGLSFVTDNDGRVAFLEPGLMDREIFFTIRGHGYTAKKDGFGYAGVRLVPKAGHKHEIRIDRTNIAERLGRLTGEGMWRDSVLLGHRAASPESGRVAGQDSIQAAVHGGKIYWFWGDTSRMEYPLGLFRMAGATTPAKGFDPASGVPYEYFTDPKTKFARAMMPLPERPEGVVWIFAVFVVPDETGRDRLVGHYSRRKGLEDEYEQGIAVFNDDKQIFEPAKQLPLSEKWRRPSGHPILREEDGIRWLIFGSPNPNVRVPATLKDVLDPSRYEAFTCQPRDGIATWRWQKDLPPVDSKRERAWIKDGSIKPENARFCPVNAEDSKERITLHSGSVRWNSHRKKWILVAGQIEGRASFLGEVWYAEADAPTGPFVKAVRVVTHDRQTFYNVCHHDFLDRDDGRTIHFEGTYTNDFSGNPVKTPRYNYNQMMYRLDLDSPRLRLAR